MTPPSAADSFDKPSLFANTTFDGKRSASSSFQMERASKKRSDESHWKSNLDNEDSIAMINGGSDSPDKDSPASDSSLNDFKTEQTFTHFPEKNKPENVVKWLRSNYEPTPLASLPRVVLYDHYCEFCDQQSIARLNTAGFGRLLRQTFPNLKTRRLGHRGNSKYFYQGIRVQSSSALSRRLDVINTMRTGERRSPSFSSMRTPRSHSITANGSSPRSVVPIAPTPSSTTPTVSQTSARAESSPQAPPQPQHQLHQHHHHQQQSQNQQQPIDRKKTSSSSIESSISSESSSSHFLIDSDRHSNKMTVEQMQGSMPIMTVQPQGSTRQIRMASGPAAAAAASVPVAQPPSPKLGSIGGDMSIEWPRFYSSDPVFTMPQFRHFLEMFAQHLVQELDYTASHGFILAHATMQLFWIDNPHEILMEVSLKADFACFIRDSYIVLFSVILSKLLPNLLQPLTMEVIKDTREFALRLEGLATSLSKLYNGPLKTALVETVRAFTQALRRGVFLNHVTQAASTVLTEEKQVSQMVEDWKTIDWNVINDQAFVVCGCSNTMLSYCEGQVSNLLNNRFGITHWVDWLQLIVSRSLGDKVTPENIGQRSRDCILKWTYAASLLVRDFAVRSAASFGSFQLLRLFADECIQAIVDQHYTSIRFQLYAAGPIRLIHPSLLLLLESSGCLCPPETYSMRTQQPLHVNMHDVSGTSATLAPIMDNSMSHIDSLTSFAALTAAATNLPALPLAKPSHMTKLPQNTYGYDSL